MLGNQLSSASSWLGVNDPVCSLEWLQMTGEAMGSRASTLLAHEKGLSPLFTRADLTVDRERSPCRGPGPALRAAIPWPVGEEER